MKNRTLNYVLRNFRSTPCIFESRAAKYKFGIKNYGEIPSYINKADGDPWDIFAPGYNHKFPVNKPFFIDKIIGILVLENGNHKLAVRLKDVPILSPHFEHFNCLNYSQKYCKFTKIKGTYIKLPKLN